ncbi:dihydroorotase [uncultured Helicobacter sp.]|uniref:dihydroorotase n=1 Tax=uncultured Helicobacter sp. TaxID=175537 RepID=UPI00374EE488
MSAFFERFFGDFLQSREYQEITLSNPLDMHLHLRQGAMLESVLPFSARDFALGVVMPNLNPPIMTTALALQYRDEIVRLSKGLDFVPFMTLYLHENLDKGELTHAYAQGIRILKLYPRGATTGSENGVREVVSERILEILHIAQDLGFMLSIHGESNGYCMDREFEFLEVYEFLARTFPRLKIIIEHMSDRRSLESLERYENLYATITLHHILLSLDDVLGNLMHPDLFCKPMIKTPKDRDSLLACALSAHPKVSFGSDSAPHLQSKKYSASAPGGIFSAPIALSMLASVFAYHNKLENLQAFVSDNAYKNYELDSVLGDTHKVIKFCAQSWEIPQSIACENSAISVLFGGKQCVFGRISK